MKVILLFHVKYLLDGDCPMFRRFYVQKVLCSEKNCSKGFMLRRYYIQKVLCSEGPMFRSSYIQKVLCSEGPMLRRSFVQKVLCSEGSVFRRFYVQKVLCSEIFVQKVLCLKSMGDFVSSHWSHVFATLIQRRKNVLCPSGFRV